MQELRGPRGIGQGGRAGSVGAGAWRGRAGARNRCVNAQGGRGRLALIHLRVNSVCTSDQRLDGPGVAMRGPAMGMDERGRSHFRIRHDGGSDGAFLAWGTVGQTECSGDPDLFRSQRTRRVDHVHGRVAHTRQTVEPERQRIRHHDHGAQERAQVSVGESAHDDRTITGGYVGTGAGEVPATFQEFAGTAPLDVCEIRVDAEHASPGTLV